MNKIIKISLIIIVVCIATLLVLLSFSNQKNQQRKESDKDYNITTLSEKELVDYSGHPKVFDQLGDVDRYVSTVNDSRVDVIYTEKAKTLNTRGEIPYNGRTVTFVRSSTNKEYISAFNIEIRDVGYAQNLTVDDALKIALSYLPDNFNKLYKCDAAYIMEHENRFTYVYSARLNSEGVTYHNDSHSEYSSYLSFYIVKDDEKWTIFNDSEAYGGKDKGWIDKYTTPWEISLEGN